MSSSSSGTINVTVSNEHFQQNLRDLLQLTEKLLERLEAGQLRTKQQLQIVEAIQTGETAKCHTWDSTLNTMEKRKKPEPKTTCCYRFGKKADSDNSFYEMRPTPKVPESAVAGVPCHPKTALSVSNAMCCRRSKNIDAASMDMDSSGESSEDDVCSDPLCSCRTEKMGSQQVVKIVSLAHTLQVTSSSVKSDQHSINIVQKGAKQEQSLTIATINDSDLGMKGKHQTSCQEEKPQACYESKQKESCSCVKSAMSKSLVSYKGPRPRVSQMSRVKDKVNAPSGTQLSIAPARAPHLHAKDYYCSSGKLKPDAKIVWQNVSRSQKPCACKLNSYSKGCPCPPPPEFDSSGHRIFPISNRIYESPQHLFEKQNIHRKCRKSVPKNAINETSKRRCSCVPKHSYIDGGIPSNTNSRDFRPRHGHHMNNKTCSESNIGSGQEEPRIRSTCKRRLPPLKKSCNCKKATSSRRMIQKVSSDAPICCQEQSQYEVDSDEACENIPGRFNLTFELASGTPCCLPQPDSCHHAHSRGHHDKTNASEEQLDSNFIRTGNKSPIHPKRSFEQPKTPKQGEEVSVASSKSLCGRCRKRKFDNRSTRHETNQRKKSYQAKCRAHRVKASGCEKSHRDRFKHGMDERRRDMSKARKNAHCSCQRDQIDESMILQCCFCRFMENEYCKLFTQD